MYDDALTGANYRAARGPHNLHRSNHPHAHWYDEPPYESDPDDFLMSSMAGGGPAATIQVGRNSANIGCPDVLSSKICCHRPL